MKRNLFYVVIVIILSFGSILLIQFLKLDNANNGFKRKFANQSFEIIRTIELPSAFFYFAGERKEKFYFKDLKNAAELYSVNFGLSNVNKRFLSLPSDENLRKNKVNIGVSDSSIYATGDLSGDLTIISDTGKYRSFKNPKFWFDQTQLASSTSIFGRGISMKMNKLQMKIIKFNYPQNRIDNSYLLKNSFGDVFETDGILQFDIAAAKLFYMYFYRGEFVCLDTNLILKYKAKTIDTVVRGGVKISVLSGSINNVREKTTTQSAPVKVVNKAYALYQNRLYILSNLKADNEPSSKFRKNQVIDVYSQDSGKYIYSFYIPKYENKKLQDFRVSDKFIFAIFENYLVKFELQIKNTNSV